MSGKVSITIGLYRNPILTRVSRSVLGRCASCSSRAGLPLAGMAAAPAGQGIADCTEQSAKSSNLMPGARKSVGTAWQTPQRDVY